MVLCRPRVKGVAVVVRLVVAIVTDVVGCAAVFIVDLVVVVAGIGCGTPFGCGGIRKMPKRKLGKSHASENLDKRCSPHPGPRVLTDHKNTLRRCAMNSQ